MKIINAEILYELVIFVVEELAHTKNRFLYSGFLKNNFYQNAWIFVTLNIMPRSSQWIKRSLYFIIEGQRKGRHKVPTKLLMHG